MGLIDRMKIRNKLILMLLFSIIGLLYFSISGIAERVRQVNEMDMLQPLSALTIKIGNMVHELQKERGMTSGFISSKGAKFTAELPEQRRESDKRITESKAFPDRFKSIQYGSEFKEGMDDALKRLDRLEGVRNTVTALGIPAGEAVRYYTDTIKSFLQVIANITSVSSDARVSKPVFAYLFLLNEKEKAGIERATLTGVFAANKFEGDGYYRFASTVTSQSTYHDVFLVFADRGQKDFYTGKVRGQSVEDADRMRKVAMDKAKEGDFGIDSAAWFAAMTGKINLLKEVENKLAADIDTTAGGLKSEASSSLLFYAAFSFILISTG